MNVVSLNCAYCGTPFKKPIGEYNRRIKLGYDYFFCSLSCTSSFRHATMDNRVRMINKVCPYCGHTFESNTSAKAATYCSHSCASLATITPCRRESARRMGKRNSGNLKRAPEDIASVLRVREAWKYAMLREFLENVREDHIFEYVLPDTNCIYDLALPKRKILVEFDAYHHASNKKRDAEKDEVAKNNGWGIMRITTSSHSVIHPSVLDSVFQKPT